MTRSGDKFAQTMTAELSWSVQMCPLIESLDSKLEHKILQVSIMSSKLLGKIRPKGHLPKPG